jgi:hypothetical protein
VRDKSRRAREQEETRMREEAIEEASRIILLAAGAGRTPSLRWASDVTGETWRASQRRAVALQLLRAQLIEASAQVLARQIREQSLTLHGGGNPPTTP